MSDILKEIEDYKREEIAAAKRANPIASVEARAKAAPAPRGFVRAIREKLARGDYALIAEVKKASPSKGLIRADFDPATLAQAYRDGGATCLSVLTDEPYFQGRDEYLVAARAAVDLPVLRKDFMLDPYQIAESRALGADAVLLIMAALDDGQVGELHAAAVGWGMDVLVEVHDETELARALHLPARLIGINNRNLKTLAVDLTIAERLTRLVGPDCLVVAESGLSSPADLARMARAGASIFLIGESLMREADVTAATKRLLARPAATKRSA